MHMNIAKWALLILINIIIISCGGYEGSYDNGIPKEGDTANEDAASGDGFSHNAGTNCMSAGCHNGDNENIKVFGVAGTVYKSDGTIQTEATVNLYAPNSNFLLASIETDNSGNFFTTDQISGISQGVSVEVEGEIGIRTMPQNPSVGSCNNCHNGETLSGIIAD